MLSGLDCPKLAGRRVCNLFDEGPVRAGREEHGTHAAVSKLPHKTISADPLSKRGMDQRHQVA